MSDYIGTRLLDCMIVEGIEPSSDCASPQEYRSFFGDEICTRVVAMADIFLNYNDLFYQYLGSENDISYWGCDQGDFCICVDESKKIFVKQPDSIIRERNIDGMDSSSSQVPDQVPSE